MTNKIKKVIIIGAPRSGTNMLRDALTSFDGIATWPCDEINYIWRHGNAKHPSDQIPASKASARIKKYINDRFAYIGKKYHADIVVEKTTANSLRVPFVDAVVPDAKYIFIYRDGIDAAGSALLRWTAKLDYKYLLKKARFVPLTDIPYYGLRYLWARLYRLFSKEKRVAFWGPSLDNLDALLDRHTLNEVCALQWQECVVMAEEALSIMPKDKVFKVRYESFVKNPHYEIKEILKFLEKKTDNLEIENALKNISAASIGKGRDLLGEAEVNKLRKLVGATLKNYGYK